MHHSPPILQRQHVFSHRCFADTAIIGVIAVVRRLPAGESNSPRAVERALSTGNPGSHGRCRVDTRKLDSLSHAVWPILLAELCTNKDTAAYRVLFLAVRGPAINFQRIGGSRRMRLAKDIPVAALGRELICYRYRTETGHY